MVDLEIYDCTLREGEQAVGASFDLKARIELFKLLDGLGVDFIEIGWPSVSEEIGKSIKECKKIRKNAKIVAFGSTSRNKNCFKDENLKKIVESSVDCACIFGKSWVEHVRLQLGINEKENLEKIENSVRFLKENKIKEVFYDAEHYFDAYLDNREYALKTLMSAVTGGASRLVLCDTNGGILWNDAERIVRETRDELDKKGMNVGLGVHFHNDCGFALINTMVCLPYVKQVQGTINGIGERVGNLNLTEFLCNCARIGEKLKIELKKLKHVNDMAFWLSGIEAQRNRPFVGESAFAHKGGVHIDAILKGARYEHSNPEDFGNKRKIIFNSLGGKNSVIEIAREFGYGLDKNDAETKKAIDCAIKELAIYEKKGYNIGDVKAEHFIIIERFFGKFEEFFKIKYWKCDIKKRDGKEKSKFFFNGFVNGKKIKGEQEVDGGPIEAAYKCIKNVLNREFLIIKKLEIKDYHVNIAKRKSEESSVRTAIKFSDGEEFEIVGVDKNLIASGIEAITKGINYFLNKTKKENLKGGATKV